MIFDKNNDVNVCDNYFKMTVCKKGILKVQSYMRYKKLLLQKFESTFFFNVVDCFKIPIFWGKIFSKKAFYSCSS